MAMVDFMISGPMPSPYATVMGTGRVEKWRPAERKDEGRGEERE
jgi:hypothetical protein